MGAVSVDASVVIGFLEPTDVHHQRAVDELRPWLHRDHHRLLTASAYSESLVGVVRRGLADRLERFVDEGDFAIVPVDRSLARLAAELRARHGALRLPDALVLAAARAHGAELLTFDAPLAGAWEQLR